MQPLLYISDLEKSYGQKQALSGFNLSLSRGCIHGLVGPNGAGKTTLIRLINQIYRPDRGCILFNGERLSPKHVQQIGYMPEERGLYMNMYLEEQLIYLGRLKGMHKKEVKEKIIQWLDYLNLTSSRDKKISALSKGMAQKVQFIATILHDPKLIIFDEPFSGLDPINTDLIRQEILKLKEKGHSILLSTHRMESAEGLCDEVIFINCARKILQGTPLWIKNHFKQEGYRVQMELRGEHLWKRFLKTYAVSEIKKHGNHCTFKVKKNANHSAENLIKYLVSIGEIQSFEQEVPTLEEIFMQLIKNDQNA